MAIPYHGLFSEALNSQSLVTGVSPQTGVFQACLTMAEITVGIQQPAVFSLKLSVGMNSTIKVGSADYVVNFPVDGTYIKYPLSCASFNIPYISTLDSKWYTASGAVESISSYNNGHDIKLVYHKVKDVLIESISKPSENLRVPGGLVGVWKVKYKDGTTEYYSKVANLNGELNQYHGFLFKLVTSAGHTLLFEYDKFWRIISISDAANKNNKIEINYGDPLMDGAGMIYTVTQATYGKTFESKISLRDYIVTSFRKHHKFYVVDYVTLPNMPDQKYRFGHRRLDDSSTFLGDLSQVEIGLYDIETPYGLTQTALYTRLNYGYVNSELKTVPAVRVLYTTDIGNGVPRIRTLGNTGISMASGSAYAISYQFKAEDNTNNYTGYTPNTAVTPGRDACIYKIDNYEYSTTEVHGAADIDMGSKSGVFDKKIIRTYNRFHLLVKERTLYRDEGSLEEVVRTYTYPVVAGDITAQPANFQFWETCTTEYVMEPSNIESKSEASKTQTQRIDEFGNLLSATAESGISLTYEYYDVAELTDCPAALNGIKCYVKRIDTKPKPSATEPAIADKRQEFTYKKVSGIPYTVNINGYVFDTVEPYMVLPAVTKVQTAGGMLSLTSSSYEEASTPRILIGAPVSIETTSPAVAQGQSTVEIKNWTEFSWEVIDSNNIRRKTTNRAAVSGKQKPTINAGSIESRLADGLIIKEISANNIETTYEYNQSAQLTKKTYFANQSEYKEVEEFAFEFPKQYQLFGSKNLVTYQKVRSDGEKDTSIYFRYYLGASLQVCDISQGKFVAGQSPSNIDPNATEYRIAKRNTYKSDGSLLSSNLLDHCKTSGSSASAISITTNMNEMSNVSSTTSPTEVMYLEAIEPRKNIVTSGVVNAPICYLQEKNDYGSVDIVRVTKFGVDKTGPEVGGYKLLVNEYDGFGRLTSTGQLKKGFVKYAYDELDRVTEEKEFDGSQTLLQTTTYKYSAHIPSMTLPVHLKCIIDEGNSVLMDAKREYDEFSRLIQQTTPNVYPSSMLTEKYEYTDQNFPYLPTKLTKDVGHVTFSYDSCTGMLLDKTLNNGLVSGQPPGLVVAFLYDKKTKLLKRSTIGQTSAVNQSRYEYTYDRFDRVSGEKVSFENDPLSYLTTYQYSSLLGMPESWDMHAGTVRCWGCEYGYDSVGRTSAIVYKAQDGREALATINIEIEYVNSTQGFASGNVESIELSLPGFSSALKNLKVDFKYDERGLEVQRVYSILGERGSSPPNETKLVFDVSNVINGEHLIEEQTIIRSYMSGTEVEGWGHYNAAGMRYTYAGLGGGVLATSTPMQYDDDGVSSPSNEKKRVNQYTIGSSKIDWIGPEGARQKYIYIADRVNATAPSKDQVGTTATYEYDNNGNVNKDPSFNFLRYNVENALSIYAQTGSTPMRETKYYYSPSGKLNQIVDPDGESVYYFYNGDILTGEVRPKLRTHYIQAGNILLGRVLVSPASSTSVNASCELEIFGADSAGSVRAVYRFTAGATEPVVNYYDYSDYGERTSS